MTIDDFPTDEFHRAREHFNRLLDLEPGQRGEYVDRLREVDPELASIVMDLLEHLDDPENADEARPFAVRHGLSEGDVVTGRYRIVRLIGEGGMAEVYLARRIDGIDQEVALKLVRGGSRMMVERFVRERQILARLSHPRIAHLTDGGLTDDGLPWFAMEYIRGEPIHTWCDRQRLDLRERARLFARVCRAVQFAHRNLVLHRDLKPSNILVDDLGQPHLLDFGIAKLIDATDPEKAHTVAMTPAYAAPEQLRGQAVSTSSDIYQLGLVLRQLLTGAAPDFASSPGTGKLCSLPHLDQTFADYSREDAERIARARASQPGRLKRSLRGDLDRLVRRATAEDPRERYETAQALADDLDRWRRGLPVRAHGGAFGYRLAKLLRRHAVAASIVLLCVLGLAASAVYSWNRAAHEYAERQRAEIVLDFMRSIFRQAKPDIARGEQPTPIAMLERASVELNDREDLDDATHAALLTEIAQVLFELDELQQAEKNAKRAVAMLEPIRDRHRLPYLQAVYQLIMIRRQLVPGEWQFELIDQAMQLARNEGVWHANFLRSRGEARYGSGEFEAGERDVRAAIKEYERLGETSGVAYVGALNLLGVMRANRGHLREGLEWMERAAEAARQGDGIGPQRELILGYTIALYLHYLGDMHQALKHAESLLDQSLELLGPAHDRTRRLRALSAHCNLSLDRHKRAEAQLERIRRADLDVSNPTVPVAIDLAEARLDLDRGRVAAVLNDTARILETSSSDSLKLTAQLLRAEARLTNGECDKARPVFQDVLERPRQSSGYPAGLAAAEARDGMGRCYALNGRYVQAKQYLEEAVRQFRQVQGDNGISVWRSRVHLAWARVLETRDPDFLAELVAGRDALAGFLGTEDTPRIWQLDILIDTLAAELGRPGIKPEHRRRAVEGLAAFSGRTEFTGLPAF